MATMVQGNHKPEGIATEITTQKRRSSHVREKHLLLTEKKLSISGQIWLFHPVWHTQKPQNTPWVHHIPMQNEQIMSKIRSKPPVFEVAGLLLHIHSTLGYFLHLVQHFECSHKLPLSLGTLTFLLDSIWTSEESKTLPGATAAFSCQVARLAPTNQ